MSKVFILKWSILSKVGNSKTFKTSFVWLLIVPLVAKLFYNIETISFAFNEKSYTLDLSLSFSFQMLFFSAVFATFGQILYTLFAPSIISNYNSYNEFKNEGKGREQLKTEYKKLLEEIVFSKLTEKVKYLEDSLTNFDESFKEIGGYPSPTLSAEIIDLKSKDKETILSSKNIIKIESFAFIDKLIIDENKEAEVFWYIRDEIDNIKALPRCFATVFYILAFLVLGLIAIENIYYVITQSNLDIFQYIKEFF